MARSLARRINLRQPGTPARGVGSESGRSDAPMGQEWPAPDGVVGVRGPRPGPEVARRRRRAVLSVRSRHALGGGVHRARSFLAQGIRADMGTGLYGERR